MLAFPPVLPDPALAVQRPGCPGTTTCGSTPTTTRSTPASSAAASRSASPSTRSSSPATAPRSPATAAAWPTTRRCSLPEHGRHRCGPCAPRRAVTAAFADAVVEERDLTVYDRATGVGVMAATTTTKPAGRSRLPVPGAQGAVAGPAVERLAERARADGWTHEEFLAACLEREVAARQPTAASCASAPPASRPARPSRSSTSTTNAPSSRDVVAHLGALDFVDARDNVVFLGPPGTGKTHLAIGLSHPRLPSRPPRRVRHRRRMGRPPRRRPQRRPAPRRAPPPRPLPAARHRRGRLHPLRSRRRQPVLPARLRPLRTRLGHRHLATSRSAAGARSSATPSSPPP